MHCHDTSRYSKTWIIARMDGCWKGKITTQMGSVLIVVAPELCKFSLKILRIPEQRVIEVFTADRSEFERNDRLDELGKIVFGNKTVSGGVFRQ